MTRRRFLTGFAATGIFLIASACSDETSGSKRYPDYRYRLTVEVDTPEGLKTGSSVIEVSTAKSGASSIPSPNTISTRVRGEAVTVDLGKRGVLFALLRTEYSVDWASGVLASSAKPVTFEEVHDEIEKTNRDPSFDISMKRTLALTGKHEVQRYYEKNAYREKGKPFPPSYYPIMVTFRDMADPKSVIKIDPDNLAESFGDGVELKRLTVERTDDPVTSGIEKRLVWLSATQGSLTKQPRDPVTNQLIPLGQTSLSTQLTGSDFIRSKPQ